MVEKFTSLRFLVREFLTLGILGAIASVIGIGSGINSIFGGGGGGTQPTPSAPTSGAAPSFYQPTGQGQADQSWLDAMNQINRQVFGQVSQVEPQLSNAYQRMTSVSPQGYVNAGNQAGQQYGQQAQIAQMLQQIMMGQAGTSQGAQQQLMGQGQQQFGAGQGQQQSGQGMQQFGQGIMQNAQPLIQAGNQAFSAGQDPQKALYDKLLQQTQDQSRAATSMRGIGTSPESAGIENQAVQNFNIGWENEQLSRMLQGLSGMGGAYGQAANQYGAGTSAYGAGTGAFGAGTAAGQAGTNAYNAAGSQGALTGANLTGAQQFGGMAPGYTLQSGQVPFQTAYSAYGAPIQATNQYTGAMNQGIYDPYGGIQSSMLPYLGYGGQQAGNAFKTGQAQQGFGAQQSQGAMTGITAGLNSLGTQMNTPGSWLSGVFGGQQQPQQNYGAAYDSGATGGGYAPF